MFQLDSIRYNSCQLALPDWALISVGGNDREAFFQGQVTNDLALLGLKEGHFTARLNRAGKLQSFFVLAKREEELLILCPLILVEKILEDLNKFIIMDDVVLKRSEEKVYIHFNYFLAEEHAYLFTFNCYGIPAAIRTSHAPGVPQGKLSELEEIRWLNGYPQWGKDVSESMFINDSYLNEVAISYKKGCFLGQETVAKIENNRGGAYYPMLFVLDREAQIPLADFSVEGKKAGKIYYQKKNILQVHLLRDFRVEAKNLTIVVQGMAYTGSVFYLPFYKNQTRASLASELYHLGVDEFQKEKIESAMNYMKKAIAFDPELSDAYESIGVILGRRGEYEEAIGWMDKLLSVKDSSVMAHTNKSLFYMKLGKIEEAEKEKAQATLKSFSMYGEEAKNKKIIDEERKKKESDMLKREKMFQQVLEIDPGDTIALYGMADIAFYRGHFEEAQSLLHQVVENDEKYSTAYLLLGKSLEAVGNREKAKLTYEKGIEIASKRGDMMPANEMQSRLNQLVMGPRLL